MTRAEPMHSGWVDGTTPFAFPVSAIGESIATAMRVRASPALIAPPPAMIIGRFAPARSCAARAISDSIETGDDAWFVTRVNGSTNCSSTSVGMAMCTGRGRLDVKTFHARSISAGSFVGSVTVSLNAVTVRTTAD